MLGMNKQLISSVKGTRDFYPEDMPFRSWFYGKIRKVSEKFGYQEFDGPNIEYMDLYLDKTSEEILKDQVFSMKDRDDRTLVLRPEITPTFARMVAQKSQQILRPIRWYSIGRGYRYEQPQKGRGREFFQWEINLLGPQSPEADGEIIAIAAEFFKELGFTPEEVVIRVNDRSYFEQILSENKIDSSKFMPLLRIVDRKAKITSGEFDQLLIEEGLTQEQVASLNQFFNDKDYSKSEWLSNVFNSLKNYPGVLEFVEYDPTIARGFDYYTRTVFEAWDKTGNLRRSLFGGGRFDNLTETLGGERVPGVGMAPGDMPIQVLLEQFNKMPDLKPNAAKVLVTVFSQELLNKSLEIGSRLRSNDISTELYLDGDTKLDKQLKYADQKGIPFVIICGPDEVSKDQIVLKDLENRTQVALTLDELLQKLSS